MHVTGSYKYFSLPVYVSTLHKKTCKFSKRKNTGLIYVLIKRTSTLPTHNSSTKTDMATCMCVAVKKEFNYLNISTYVIIHFIFIAIILLILPFTTVLIREKKSYQQRH